MSLDILISFDTTGSMMPCLAEVRRKVVDFVDNIYNQYPSNTIEDAVRIGIIAHGDYYDAGHTYVTSHCSFASYEDRYRVINFVNNVERTGGGDAPECYELVLHEALKKFHWKADNRIMILIGDSEPHKEYEAQNRERLNWKTEADRLIESGVLIYPVQCLRYTNRVDYFYDYLAKQSKVPKLELAQFSNITELLTAVFYKQVSDELVLNYGEALKAEGLLNRNLAHIINLLLEADSLVGGIEYTESKKDLEAVHPARFQVLNVDKPCVIKEFVESTGAKFVKGKGFYQLSKRELVQEYKEVVVRNNLGDMFSGDKAREMIGLPYGRRGNISTDNIPYGYDVFIQSTSYTRKLMPHTQFLYETEEYKTFT